MEWISLASIAYSHCLAHSPSGTLPLQEVRRAMWPAQAAHPPFVEYLKRLYDHTQLEAIEVSVGSSCPAARRFVQLHCSN